MISREPTMAPAPHTARRRASASLMHYNYHGDHNTSATSASSYGNSSSNRNSTDAATWPARQHQSDVEPWQGVITPSWAQLQQTVTQKCDNTMNGRRQGYYYSAGAPMSWPGQGMFNGSQFSPQKGSQQQQNGMYHNGHISNGSGIGSIGTSASKHHFTGPVGISSSPNSHTAAAQYEFDAVCGLTASASNSASSAKQQQQQQQHADDSTAAASVESAQSGGEGSEALERSDSFYQTSSARPPYSFATLICKAILALSRRDGRAGATLKGIYAWIQENFCFYRCKGAAAQSWRSSIRHNLVFNRAFSKVEYGEGAKKVILWDIAEAQRSQVSADGVLLTRRTAKKHKDSLRGMGNNNNNNAGIFSPPLPSAAFATYNNNTSSASSSNAAVSPARQHNSFGMHEDILAEFYAADSTPTASATSSAQHTGYVSMTATRVFHRGQSLGMNAHFGNSGNMMMNNNNNNNVNNNMQPISSPTMGYPTQHYLNGGHHSSMLPIQSPTATTPVLSGTVGAHYQSPVMYGGGMAGGDVTCRRHSGSGTHKGSTAYGLSSSGASVGNGHYGAEDDDIIPALLREVGADALFTAMETLQQGSQGRPQQLHPAVPQIPNTAAARDAQLAADFENINALQLLLQLQ